MLQKIVMPKLGDTMEEGTIVRWLVDEGDAVKKGDVLMEVETDKVTLEVESLVEGTVLRLDVPAEQTVPVGAVLGYVGDAEDKLPEAEEKQPVESAAQTPCPAAAVEEVNTTGPPGRSGSPRVSPRALKLAAKLGVDITQIPGTGPGGRVVTKDVETCYANRCKTQNSGDTGDAGSNVHEEKS
ncbi:MAG: biotin/lipoyl-containing protein [Planctomycetota bacterium]|nr:biotin/lipoyl-containing protein [Planctomycetota bacterium]